MYIKATLRYHFTFVRMGIIKRQTITSAGEDVEGMSGKGSGEDNMHYYSERKPDHWAFSLIFPNVVHYFPLSSPTRFL